MQLIDTHCHLDDERFDQDRAEVIQRARAVGVELAIVPSVVRSGWSKLAGLAETTLSMLPAYGLHPWFCDQHRQEDLVQLSEYLKHSVAVGECGLDFGQGRTSEEEQLKWFRAQLALADEHQLPVIVHAYKSLDRVIAELKLFPGLRGVVHSFSGSRQQAERLIEIGFYLGIGGVVTRPQAEKLRVVVTEMPLEFMLLETDAPDQPGYSHRGERNEPAYLVEIATEIATMRDMDAVTLAGICNQNARELFSL
jgi:TatD DNase family protein